MRKSAISLYLRKPENSKITKVHSLTDFKFEFEL